MKPFVRLGCACLLSVAAYAGLSATVLDRALSDGYLRGLMAAKLARGAAAGTPKLVILAGSNGLYSHRCATIEAVLDMPCANGAVAIGLGLDYVFARWSPLLRAGDVVYLPMEEAQYGRGRAAMAGGPDAAILWRHDWATLARLAPDRWVAAAFARDLRGTVMAAAERALAASGFRDRRAEVTGEVNAWGDHVGHTLALAAGNRDVLARAVPAHATAADVTGGYGARLIADFVRAMRARGVTVVGGLPTGFADSPPDAATVAAIRALYEGAGAMFLALPNRSRYPRAAFFDTPDHLAEPCQIAHSRQVARALAALLGRPAREVAAGDGCEDVTASR
jgi:hypothetical protein